MWFDEDEMILLLRALAGTTAAARRAHFEAVSLCRRRDRRDWSGMSISAVFTHGAVPKHSSAFSHDTPCSHSTADEQILQRIRKASIKVLTDNGGSVRHVTSFRKTSNWCRPDYLLD